MPKEHDYYVYILSSRSRNLYVGVTNKLYTRVGEHRDGKADSFTARYKTTAWSISSGSSTSRTPSQEKNT